MLDELPKCEDVGPVRIEIADAIALAAMTMKAYYNKTHHPKFFDVDDKVLLRLHKGYSILKSAILGKYGPKFAGPFRVIEWIGRSAYKLDFPASWKIHNVISIDHLEPFKFDPYGRQLPLIGPVRTQDHERKIIDH